MTTTVPGRLIFRTRTALTRIEDLRPRFGELTGRHRLRGVVVPTRAERSRRVTELGSVGEKIWPVKRRGHAQLKISIQYTEGREKYQNSVSSKNTPVGRWFRRHFRRNPVVRETKSLGSFVRRRADYSRAATGNFLRTFSRLIAKVNRVLYASAAVYSPTSPSGRPAGRRERVNSISKQSLVSRPHGHDTRMYVYTYMYIYIHTRANTISTRFWTSNGRCGPVVAAVRVRFVSAFDLFAGRARERRRTGPGTSGKREKVSPLRLGPARWRRQINRRINFYPPRAAPPQERPKTVFFSWSRSDDFRSPTTIFARRTRDDRAQLRSCRVARGISNSSVTKRWYERYRRYQTRVKTNTVLKIYPVTKLSERNGRSRGKVNA